MNIKISINLWCGLFLLLGSANCTRTPVAAENNLVSQAPLVMPKRESSFLEIAGGSLGESCVPGGKELSRGDCQDGYICVPNTIDPKVGSCLIDCGQKVGDTLAKKTEVCPKDYRCQLLGTNDLLPIGMFCLKPQKYKDMRCDAPFDQDACLNGLSCLPTSYSMNELGKRIASRYRCKQECGVENPCADAKEECLFPKYARKVKQPSKGLKESFTSCDVLQCKNNDVTCSCDKALGYSCEPIVPGVDTGVCMRTLGICSKPISLAGLNDFKGHNYLGETCNEVNDNRVCKNQSPGNSAHGAKPTCYVVSDSQEGICLSMCGIPSVDRNGDGAIDKNEAGFMLPCPAGYSCQTDIARKLPINVYVKLAGQNKPCDPSNCQKAIPCPSECGPGDAECLEIGKGEQQRFVCGAPIGTCIAD